MDDLDEALSLGQFQVIDIGDININNYSMQIIWHFNQKLERIYIHVQVGLDILYAYCNRWKLTMNTEKKIETED